MNNTTFFINMSESAIDKLMGIQECCPCDPVILEQLLEKYTLIYNMLYVVLAVWIFDVVVNRGGFKKFFGNIWRAIRNERK